MASELTAQVLGPFRLLRGGREVDVGGSRQREVLARLSVADGHPVSAEALLTDIWGPNAGDSTSSLHVSISKLRRAIDPDRRARADSPLISAGSGYALHVDTDLAEAEAYAEQASDLMRLGNVPEALDIADRARSAWRGEPYEGLGEHAWLVLERRRCEEVRLRVIELAAEARLRLGREPRGVVVDLLAPVEQHPSHERLAVLLAAALYREQRQDDALRVLRITRDHLREEAGLDPGPDLQRLERAILAQEPDPYASPAPQGLRLPHALLDASVDPAVRKTPVRWLPLVGRRRSRAVLDAAAEAAAAGQPTTVLMVGEAGIGKTRLAQSMTDDLTKGGWRSVWSRATEDGGAPALWPWLSAVQQLGELAPLDPDLERLVASAATGTEKDGRGYAASGTDAAAERWRQTQRVAELLDAATANDPMVLVLDDLHWADTASQALLADLTTRSAGNRLLVLVTTRPTGSRKLTSTLARLARLGVVRLDLDGLTDADVRALAAGAGLDIDAGALRARTGGNPFLLQETLAFAAETGASPLDVVPSSVADVLGARLDRLPSPGDDVLMVASVLGSVIDPATVAKLADLEPGVVDDALDAALEVGLLSDEDGGALRFRHDLVRETAYQRLGAVRRSRMHARALTLLVDSGRLNPSALALHAAQAGPTAAEEGVRWSMLAAAEASTRRAPDSALYWWRAACAADLHALVPDTARRIEVLLGMLRAQLDAGDAVGAIETRTAAVQAAVDHGDPALLTAALTSLDRPLVWLPRPMGQVNEEMVGHLERALEAQPGPAPADRCMLAATLAIELYSSEHEERCDALSSEAVRLAQEGDDPARRAFAVNARILATAFAGRERERAEAADVLVDIGHNAGLPSFELAGHQLACRMRLQLFEVRAADAHAQQARRLADGLHLQLPVLQQRLWDVSRAALENDVTTSMRMLDEVAGIDWPWWGRESMLATIRVTLLLRARQFTALAPFLDAAAEVHPRIAADARVVAGLPEGGGQTLGDSSAPPRDWSWLSSGCIHAQAALAVGQREAIETAYDVLLPGSGMIAATGSFDAGPVDGYLADLAAALGRDDQETQHRELLAHLSAREGLTRPTSAL
jgi:DNA-binding SARP family transcriptional activator